jgi:hypothetical protein
MSLTKRSEHYARHMDERYRTDDRDYDLEYREHLYLQAVDPKDRRTLQDDEQPETQQPKPVKTNDNVEQRKERK